MNILKLEINTSPYQLTICVLLSIARCSWSRTS